MLRKTTLMAAMAISFLSTPVQAVEHVILIMQDDYFPAKSYVLPGDTLRFINQSDFNVNVISADGAWSTGSLNVEAEASVGVTQGMSKDFYHEGVFDQDGNPAVTGILQFGAAPQN